MKQRDFIKQKDSMQCGVASLAMICRHFKANYSIDFITELCHVTKQGVSMKGIADAADSLGLKSNAGKLTVDQLTDCPLPAILYWNQNHFVVLYKITGNGKTFHVADPGKGMCKFDRNNFEHHWVSVNSNNNYKGVAMFFEPTELFGKEKETNVSGRKSFSFLLGYLKKNAS